MTADWRLSGEDECREGLTKQITDAKGFGYVRPEIRHEEQA
jgi:hypothetical protein